MSDNPSARPAWRGIRAALVIAGGMIAGGLLLALARKQGMIELDTLARGGNVLIGLGLAAVGNIMPKMLDGPPPQTLALAALQQAVHRVGGWAMTLAGLAYAGLWTFAPFGVAATGGMVAIGAGVAVLCGNVAWRASAYHRSPASWARRPRTTDDEKIDPEQIPEGAAE